MLIPSIDLQGGKIVQLVQGERLAIETGDVDVWVRKFAGYSKVQLIDLDAAKGAGANESMVAHICGLLPVAWAAEFVRSSAPRPCSPWERRK
jgi:phosphoribosylformimino-5-aminoimidazole carboxamide ribotide isomerase